MKIFSFFQLMLFCCSAFTYNGAQTSNNQNVWLPQMGNFEQKMQQFQQNMQEFQQNMQQQTQNYGNTGNSGVFIPNVATAQVQMPNIPGNFNPGNFGTFPNFGGFGQNFPFGNNNQGDCRSTPPSCSSPGYRGPTVCPSGQMFGVRQEFIEPSGMQGSDSRQLGQFSKVVNAGAFIVDLIPSQGAPRIEIQADSAFIPFIKTEVNGDTLLIYFDCNKSMRCSSDFNINCFNNHCVRSGNTRICGEMKVLVFTDPSSLSAITLSGSGPITTTGQFSAQNFEIILAGSGPITAQLDVSQSMTAAVLGSGSISLQGQAENARYTLAGSGGIESTQFRVKNVDSCITGSGEMNILALDTLSAVIRGSGNIRNVGKANIIRKCIQGVGSINSL